MEAAKIEWKIIPQTCGQYEVSNFGDIRESGSGKLVTVSQNSKGYAICSLPKCKKIGGGAKCVRAMTRFFKAARFFGRRAFASRQLFDARTDRKGSPAKPGRMCLWHGRAACDYCTSGRLGF